MGRTRDGIDRRIRALLEAGAVGDLGDGRLLERFASGDGEAAEAAFAALVDRHGALVWRVCRSILSDPNDADDAFQATFLALVRRSRSLWVRDSLGPWLLRVARRTALRARDRARRRRLREQAAAGSRPTSAEPRPLDDLAAIHEEIARLPERYRSVVVLCLLQGLRDEQAAARLGWPVGTVHSRLARGRARLRASLTRRGLAPSAALLASSRLPAEAASSAVPPHLVEATARAASLLVADGLRSAAVPIAVASLVEGAARMSWIANVKAGLTVALLGGAALATALGSPGDGPAADGSPTPAEASAKRADRATSPPEPPAASGPSSAVELRYSFPSDSSIAFASGTIIRSTADESIVLTSARPLVQTRSADPSEQVEASAIQVRVRPAGRADAGSEHEEAKAPLEEFEGERLAADFGRDLALIRFRPGRALPCSTILPRTAKLKRGDRLVTNARPPRKRETSLLDPDYRSPAKNHRDFRGLTCEGSEFFHDLGTGLLIPSAGSAGGQLVGVSSMWSGLDVTVYAGPEAIHHILAANGLSALIPTAQADSGVSPLEKPPAPTSPSSPDLPAYPGVVLTFEGDSKIRGMGTIIASREDETIILTAGSLFAPGGPFGQVDPSKARPKISVTLSTSLRSWLEPGPGFTQEIHRAEVIVFDSVRDVGLLRIRPGKVLPTARIVGPNGSTPASAVFEYFDTIGPMWSPFAGCRVLDEKLVRSREGVYQSIETARALKPDHIGTGLFHRTRSGEHILAGVYNAEVPRADGQAAGVFAGPAMIHHILAANGLKALIPEDERPENPPAPPPPGFRSHPSWSTVKIQADGRDRAKGSEDDGRWILGSIISSTPDESLILTSARALDPGDGRREIIVRYPDPTTPGDSPRPDRHDTVAGQLIARDTDLDLAAIRVRPGRMLPALRIAAPGRVLVEAQELLRTVWVEDGTTALRYTAVAKSDEPLLGSGQPNYRGTWCFGPPMPRDLGAPLVRRRDGSGDWEIVGVCNGGTHENYTGYYASPASIGRFLEKLAILKVDLPSLNALLSSPGGTDGPTAAPPAAQDASRPTNTSLPGADNPPAARSPSTDPPTNLEPLPGGSATPLVRIAAGGDGGAKGFGVVIRSGAGGSLALTACRLVVADDRSTPPDDIRVTVSAGPDEVYAEPAPARATFSARVVACDPARNLALLAFDAGRVLPTSEIAPRDWNPNHVVRELTVYKLDDGGHLAARRRKIVDPDVRGRMGGVEYSAIECEGAPKLDELGMPLDYGVVAEGRPRFATVGICNYSDAPTQPQTADAPPRPTTGLFASPEMIHQFLEAHDLAGLVPGPRAEDRRPAPARPFERLPKPKPTSAGAAEPAIPISEAPRPRKPNATQIVGERLAGGQERLDRVEAQVGEMNRKLDRLLDALKAPASGR